MSYPDLRTDSGGRPVSTQETDPDDFADEREAEEADEHAKAAAPGTHRTVPVQDAAAREAAARKAAARGWLDFSAQLAYVTAPSVVGEEGYSIGGELDSGHFVFAGKIGSKFAEQQVNIVFSFAQGG